jgi:cell division protein FtsL
MLTNQHRTATVSLEGSELNKVLRAFDVDENEREVQVQRNRERSQVFKNPNASLSRRGNWFFYIIVMICALAIFVFLIHAKIELAEVNSQSAAINSQLEEAKRENSRLSTVLQGMATPAKVEEYAHSIGMVKEQTSQVTYISVNVEKTIEVAPVEEKTVFNKIDDFFSSFLEHLGF